MARILQICPTYYPAVRYGGPIRSVHGLAAALVRRGHEVQVYTTSVDGHQDLDVPIGQPVDLDGVKVTYFRVPALRRLYWAPELEAELVRNVAGFDVLHLQSIYLWPTWRAARLAERAGVPYVISPRGMLVRELIRRKSRWVKTVWLNLIERRSLARAAALHVTTDTEAQEASGLGLPLPEICCVPNGVSWPGQPTPLSKGPFANLPRPYALYLGRINWKKGLDRLIRAWKWVPDLALVIAGPDDEDYRSKLELLALSEGVLGSVHFTGPVSDEHKWALYQNAELFVLPSYSENFANVVAEAMAMACPVVVTPEVGLAQLVAESGAGVVTIGEPQVLAKIIRDLMDNPAARAQMGERGRKAAIERLSWDVVAARMEAAYERAAMRAQHSPVSVSAP